MDEVERQFVKGFIAICEGSRAEQSARNGENKVENVNDKNNRKRKTALGVIWQQRNMLLGALIGAVCFLWLYGTKILNPTYDDWILASQSDLTQHYQGWQFFRKADWSFPIGMFGNLSYPLETSIIFLDSIPLLAVFFKVLSPLLPETFQYFGIYGLVCFILQGAIAAKILEKYLKNTVAVGAGTIFFTTAVFVIMRMYLHTSLASQWLILIALLIMVYYKEYFSDLKRAAIAWGILGFLCASIHLYFLLMCGFVLAGFVCKDFLENKKVKRVFTLLSVYVLCGGVTVYLLGGFSTTGSAAGNGLGTYSFNLNSFYNSRGWSELLTALPSVGSGQTEGFSYLGAGILILIPVSFAICIVANRRQLADRQWWKQAILDVLPWAVILVISVVAALSPTITLNDKTLFTIPLPSIVEKLWSIFRATGRLVWPAAYLLMIFAVCCGFRYGKRWMAAICIVLCMFLQIYDLHGSLESKRGSYQNEVTYENPLDAPVWDAIAESGKIEHVMIVDMYTASAETMYRLADYSYENGFDQNYYHYAHSLGEGPTLAWNELMSNLQDDTIYISDFSTKLRCGQYDLHYYEGNGYIIGLTWQLGEVEELDIEELSTLTYSYKDNQWLSGGEDADGVRYIHQGGMSFGPYTNIPNGTYQVIISGENLEGGSYACTSNSGAYKISVEHLKIMDTEVSFYINLPDGGPTFELLITNPGEEDIMIKEVTIKGAKYGE